MLVNIYEKLTGKFVEEVNVADLVNAIVEFVKNLLKFEFGIDLNEEADA